MAKIFEVRDPFGYLIACFEETWTEHIAKNHPEMAEMARTTDILKILAETVKTPYQVYQDVVHPRRRNFYNPFVLPRPYNRTYLKVVVEHRRMVGRKVGMVITAYPTPNIKPGERLLWQRQ